mgnify:CR=1 FL=1
MNSLKRAFGLVWLILGPLVIYGLVDAAIQFIDPLGKKDINLSLIHI